jgi:hypothetical protein
LEEGEGSVIVFCDIDGTVADNKHRVHHIERPTKEERDWDSFYDPARVMQDACIAAAVLPIKDLAGRRGIRFYFLTGRPERLRQVTQDWLLKYFDLREEILMRGDTDWRKAETYKEDSIRWASTPNEEMLFIDDDERNFKMYSKWGICLKAPECWSVFR